MWWLHFAQTIFSKKWGRPPIRNLAEVWQFVFSRSPIQRGLFNCKLIYYICVIYKRDSTSSTCNSPVSVYILHPQSKHLKILSDHSRFKKNMFKSVICHLFTQPYSLVWYIHVVCQWLTNWWFALGTTLVYSNNKSYDPYMYLHRHMHCNFTATTDHFVERGHRHFPGSPSNYQQHKCLSSHCRCCTDHSWSTWDGQTYRQWSR